MGISWSTVDDRFIGLSKDDCNSKWNQLLVLDLDPLFIETIFQCKHKGLDSCNTGKILMFQRKLDPLIQRKLDGFKRLLLGLPEI